MPLDYVSLLRRARRLGMLYETRVARRFGNLDPTRQHNLDRTFKQIDNFRRSESPLWKAQAYGGRFRDEMKDLAANSYGRMPRQMVRLEADFEHLELVHVHEKGHSQDVWVNMGHE